MKKISEFASIFGKNELEMAIILHELKINMNLKEGEFDDTKLEFNFSKKKESVENDLVVIPPLVTTPPLPVAQPNDFWGELEKNSTLSIPQVVAPPPPPAVIAPHYEVIDLFPKRNKTKMRLNSHSRRDALEHVTDVLMSHGIFLELANTRNIKDSDCYITTSNNTRVMPAWISFTNRTSLGNTPNTGVTSITVPRPSVCGHYWEWCFVYAIRWDKIFALKGEDFSWPKEGMYGSKRVRLRESSLYLGKRLKEILEEVG